MGKQNNNIPTKEIVEKYELIYPLVLKAYNDMKDFAKKKPDGIVNKFKINTLNKLLTEVKIILANDPSIIFLELLDDETLPQYSDTVIVLGQYISSLDQYKSKNYIDGDFSVFDDWKTSD